MIRKTSDTVVRWRWNVIMLIVLSVILHSTVANGDNNI